MLQSLPNALGPGTNSSVEAVFQPLGKRVSILPKTTILEAGRLAGLVLSANCGGIGICGRCRVNILAGEMYTPTETEVSLLGGADISAGQRLACRARIKSDVKIHVPASFLVGGQRLQLEGRQEKLACDAMIESFVLPSTTENNAERSDFARVKKSLDLLSTRAWTAKPRTAALISILARENNWALTVYVRGNEIIGCSGADRPALGLAVDIGCTKIAGYLVDVTTGKELAAEGVVNPQISYGEDLISRLVHADKSSSNQAQLAEIVTKAIADLVGQLCNKTGTKPREIADVCIVGNTAMVHLLLRLPVRQLLRSPFICSIDGPVEVEAALLGLDFAPGAYVHILPSIGGFVGADHVAMILACDILQGERTVLAIDVGTNTEIVLYSPDRSIMMTTSVPSGPAFEGGHISDGMRAATGAIDAVSTENGVLHFHTIDGMAPVGLCGSGVIDLVAELWRGGWINDRGHFDRKKPGVRKGDKGLEIVLIPADGTAHSREIIVTQGDIGEVQLAKAAIFAGIQSLLDMTNTTFKAIDELIVAGAFGTHMNIEKAIDIGALPRLPNARYRQVGNAAGVGAKMALVSRAMRQRAMQIADKAIRIELKEYEHFNRLLARATRFPQHEIL